MLSNIEKIRLMMEDSFAYRPGFNTTFIDFSDITKDGFGESYELNWILKCFDSEITPGYYVFEGNCIFEPGEQTILKGVFSELLVAGFVSCLGILPGQRLVMGLTFSGYDVLRNQP